MFFQNEYSKQKHYVPLKQTWRAISRCAVINNRTRLVTAQPTDLWSYISNWSGHYSAPDNHFWFPWRSYAITESEIILLTCVACMSCSQCRSLMAGFCSSPTALSEVTMFLTRESSPVKASHARTSLSRERMSWRGRGTRMYLCLE